MKVRKSKVEFFERTLGDFFKKAGREHLPWRKKNISAYEVWVSEIMLQQTQVVRVIEYYKRFLRRFPTVQSLAQASWEEFLPYYQGLGYYARGRNMLKTAKKVVKEYKGKFPQDKKALESLPGIGPYTASAILSFAYDDNHLAWDTNLRRVIGRFFLGGKQLISEESVWEENFQMKRKPLNAALMDFGSALCLGRPKCEACVLRTRCVYYKEKGKKEKKIALPKSTFPRGEAEVRLFLHERHRIYYSAEKKKLTPFILPAQYNSRAAIKKYFLERYGLTLSVRPPFGKKVFQKKPTLFIHAQILLGESIFPTFSRAEYLKLEKSLALEK